VALMIKVAEVAPTIQVWAGALMIQVWAAALTIQVSVAAVMIKRVAWAAVPLSPRVVTLQVGQGRCQRSS